MYAHEPQTARVWHCHMYCGLSMQTRYYASLLGLLPDNRPVSISIPPPTPFLLLWSLSKNLPCHCSKDPRLFNLFLLPSYRICLTTLPPLSLPLFFWWDKPACLLNPPPPPPPPPPPRKRKCFLNFTCGTSTDCLMLSCLVVTMPGSQAWVRRFESPLHPQAGWPGRYINVWRCGGLSMVLMQLSNHLKIFVKRREFLPGSGFLSRRDVTL